MKEEEPMSDTVLFVCLHASAKSLVAMEHFNRLAAERGLGLRAISAGTEPDAAVPDFVVAGLRGDGFDVTSRVPRRLTPELAAEARHIVSFGPDVAAYAPKGRAIERWDVPAVSDGYAVARAEIRGRVERLLARLTRTV